MSSTRTSKTAGEINTEAVGPGGEAAAVDATPAIAVNGVEPDTSDAKTAEVHTTNEDVPKMSELTGIKYVGVADVRSITAEDLQSLGDENPKGDLVWSAHNNFTVPTKDFSAATRDALLADPDFVAA